MASVRFPILFFAPATRTDAILASGLLGKLHDEIPHASFTVVATPDAAPLFRSLPRLERLMVTEGSGRRAQFGVWRRLKPRRWGLILDVEGFGLMPWLRARQRLGPAVSANAGEHKVRTAARLLKLEGEPPPPRLFVDEGTRARARALLAASGPFLAVAPGAGWIGASWPVERLARAASSLMDRPLAGARLLIVGGPALSADAQALRKTLSKDRCIDLTSEDDPLFVYACLEHAALFIGPASWPTHLAAAAGAPTLGLFGPHDEAVEGPWGPLARAVRGPRTVREIRAIDPNLSQPICHLMDLPVDTVVDRARRLLKEAETKKRSTPA